MNPCELTIRSQAFIDGEYDIHWLEKLVGLKK